MVAYQHHYFQTLDEYDSYALRGASKLFMRIKDPRQLENDSKLPKIKSILNYVKTVSYPYKVEFDRDTVCENCADALILQTTPETLSTCLAEESSLFDRIDFELSLGSIPSIIKNYLQKIPAVQAIGYKNVYISCMLSFISSIVFAKEDLIAFDLKEKNLKYLNALYQKSQVLEPKLYHLDNKYANYITVLLREIKHVVAAELSINTSVKLSPEACLKNLLAANLEDEQDGIN